MIDNKALPLLFAGATHRIAGVVPVKATHWVKDGDHALVSRYPIDGREFKGLLVAPSEDEAKPHKFGLRFGEWIIETVDGLVWVESSQELPSRFVPIEAPAGDGA